MKYRRSEQFKKSFKSLPRPIQEKAQKAFSLFKENPQYPSLHTKRVKGTADIWETRVDDQYRVLFRYGEDAETGEKICLFLDIGPHDILDKRP
jgi:mRNA-degrading endonuclease RelE of RelBE toxin-antitoxin system